jgi:hypothetical protein
VHPFLLSSKEIIVAKASSAPALEIGISGLKIAKKYY